MARKCGAIADQIAAAEVAAQVGMIKRARALTMATTEKTAARKRKLKRDFEKSELSSPTNYIQLRNSRIVLQDSADDRRSDHDVSCCSSNGSSERIEFADLEAEDFEAETSTYFSVSESRETTRCEHQAESDDLDSMSKPSAANARHRSTMENMPSEAELEEFFAAAEKDLQKQFVEKYNYDILKDEPLDGRYEWVSLKP